MNRVYGEVHAAGGDDLTHADRHRRGLIAVLSNRYADNIHGYATKILHEVQRAPSKPAPASSPPSEEPGSRAITPAPTRPPRTKKST